MNQGGQGVIAPLLTHCMSDAFKGAAAFFPTIRARGHQMDALFSAFGVFGGCESWEIFKPEACGLGFSMPILPGLNDLIWWPDS